MGPTADNNYPALIIYLAHYSSRALLIRPTRLCLKNSDEGNSHCISPEFSVKKFGPSLSATRELNSECWVNWMTNVNPKSTTGYLHNSALIRPLEELLH